MFAKIKHLVIDKKGFNTLRYRSRFKAKIDGDNIIITNSAGKKYVVDETLFDKVLTRFKGLDKKDRYVTSQYTDPKWKDCPNRVASVYITAMIRDYLEQ